MIFHFLVDAICGASLLGFLSPKHPDDAFALVSIYNSLAFGTQFLLGAFADYLRRDRSLWLLALALVGAGAAMAFGNPWVSASVLGAGNSLFHVSAGREVIRHHARQGRAFELGCFVAPGALGIGLACLFPVEMYVISLVAFIGVLCAFCILWPSATPEVTAVADTKSGFDWQRILAAATMTFCVFCRAASGFCVASPWRDSILLTVLCIMLVVAGKILGGLLCEHLGVWSSGLAALLLSWLLFTFLGQIVAFALIAQLVANLLMAITLYCLVRLYPRLPGFMFGLAASALLPGALVQFIPDCGRFFCLAYLLACLSFCFCGWLCTRRGDRMCSL